MPKSVEAPTKVVENSPEKSPAVPKEKEEKPIASKEKKPRRAKTGSHPPYFQMIKEALVAMNEKSGSSPYAIAKHMEEKHKAVLPANFRKILALQLKNSVGGGKLVKIKASYKLSGAGKNEKASKLAGKKPAKAVKKKKSAPVKKAKQPKSIKSPGGKKTRTK